MAVKRPFTLTIVLTAILAVAPPVWATQTHGGPEGLIVHQFSHLFFLLSMGLLIYWIRTRDLHRQAGWRHIQYAALLFMIWTLDAFTAHLLDEHYQWVRLTQRGIYQVRIETGHDLVAVFYYLAKLDHLWCVPALLFMYLGLKRLDGASRDPSPPDRAPGETEK